MKVAFLMVLLSQNFIFTSRQKDLLNKSSLMERIPQLSNHVKDFLALIRSQYSNSEILPSDLPFPDYCFPFRFLGTNSPSTFSFPLIRVDMALKPSFHMIVDDRYDRWDRCDR